MTKAGPVHRIVLVGHGMISHAYLQAFANIEQAEVVAVVGRDAARARAFAEKHGIPHSGTDLETVVGDAQATAAVICTPNALHDEGVITAARLGLHCLCEKPLHITLEAQKRMIESCQKHGVKLAVSYMRRFIPHMRFLKEVVDSGQLGRITVADVKIKLYRPREYYDSWHGTEAMDGGGPLIQQGSHMIDMALWLNEGYKEVLEAKRFQLYHDIETEDHGYALLQYGNGAIGMVEASTVCVGMDEESIEISGTNGTIAANYDRITTFEVPGIQLPPFSKEDTTRDKLFYRLAEDFLRAIEEDDTPFVDGQSAALATELIRDIYAKSGKPIHMSK